MDFLPSTPIRRAPDAVSSFVGGETIVLDFASNRFFTLDEVGGRIWELIAERGTFEGILGGVVAEFDVEPGLAKADLERLLSELASRGLVRIDPGPG
jgi:hypothetical protein